MTLIPTSVSARQPTGAPFIIETVPFRYGERQELYTVDLVEDRIYNWPMVYILSNKDTAYVGQTTSAATRMTQHGANEERKDFTTTNLIFNEEFNSSVITDYEHRLIGLMHADGQYRLTNKNAGMTDTNYFSKTQYDEMFLDLWNELRKRDLAVHTIDEIEESEVFRYSPYKGLTPDQRVALDRILSVIRCRAGAPYPIVVQGMPGTGKTILAVYLLKLLKDDPRYRGMNIKIIEPVTSLRNTLRHALKDVGNLSPDDVIGAADLIKPSHGYVSGKKQCFDILLVDESHRLKRRVNLGSQFHNYDVVNQTLGLGHEATQLDWILDQARLPVLFYDPLQVVGPSCIESERIANLLGDSVKRPIRLDSQMRVKGGEDYLKYILAVLNGRDPDSRTFAGYELVLHDDFSDFVGSFERKLSKHELTRLIAGYAWKWRTKRDEAPFDITIDGVGLRWNCTYDNWVGKGFDRPAVAHEVGCIHSIQGYDLSYAYVIIGNDLELDTKTGRLRANKSRYFDRNGYATASPEELTRYLINIYYVLLTRGIFGTHVYVENEALREYLQKYF